MANTGVDIKISADEINALIHSYLRDSGFDHTAYSLRNEANLDRGGFSGMLFRRGLLTELLTKAILYTEVETHWKQPAGTCNAPFSLLKQHTCSYNSQKDTGALAAALEDRKVNQENESDDDEEMVDSTMSKLMIPSTRQLLLRANRGEVFAAAWNPVFPETLATGSKEGWVHIWHVDPSPVDANTIPPKAAASIRVGNRNAEEDGQEVTCLEWSRDGTLLAIGTNDPSVRIWSRTTGRLVFNVEEHVSTVTSVRFSANAKHLISSALDGTIILWDVEKQRSQQKFISGQNDLLCDVVWVKDNSFAASWLDNTIHIFMIGSDTSFRIFRGHTGEINQIRITSDRKMLASASDDGTVRVWSIEPLRMAWQKGDKFIPAEGSVGGNIGQGCLHIFGGHKGLVQYCRWVPSKDDTPERLLVTMDDYTARLWDANAGSCLKIFQDHTKPPNGLAFSPSGQYLITAGLDGWLYVYSVETQEMVHCWKERTEKGKGTSVLYDADWSRDGRKLVVGLNGGCAAIIDVSQLKGAILAPRSQ